MWQAPEGTTPHEDKRGRTPDKIKIAECEKARREKGVTLAEHLTDADLKVMKTSWYPFVHKYYEDLRLLVLDEKSLADGTILRTLAIVPK